MLAVVVVALVVFRSQDSGDPAIETIEVYADAFYSGDYETGLAMLGWDASTSSDFINWSEYEAAIGAEVSVECEAGPNGDGVYACVVHYSNELFDAVDEPDVAKSWVGRVQGERIEVRNYVGFSRVEDSWRAWLEESGRSETAPCDFDVPPTPECASFQLANLVDWASWYEDRFG
jgi:hypothetical protein